MNEVVTNKFIPLHNQILLRAEEQKLSKTLDIVKPEKYKDEQQEKYRFYVESWGPHVGANQEPYFSKTEIKKGQLVWLKYGCLPGMFSPKNKDFVMVSEQDILGLYGEDKA